MLGFSHRSANARHAPWSSPAGAGFRPCSLLPLRLPQRPCRIASWPRSQRSNSPPCSLLAFSRSLPHAAKRHTQSGQRSRPRAGRNPPPEGLGSLQPSPSSTAEPSSNPPPQQTPSFPSPSTPSYRTASHLPRNREVGLTRRCSGLATLAAELHIVRLPSALPRILVTANSDRTAPPRAVASFTSKSSLSGERLCLHSS